MFRGPFGFGWAWNHAEQLAFGDDNGESVIVYYDAQRTPFEITGTEVDYAYPPGTPFELELYKDLNSPNDDSLKK